MSTDLLSLLALYIRLVSYPAGIIGVLWLMLFRPDWRHRVTSFFYMGLAFLLASQFSTVLARVLVGPDAVISSSDTLITPALVGFNVCLWGSIIWLSRRWRYEPHKWI